MFLDLVHLDLGTGGTVQVEVKILPDEENETPLLL